MLSHVNGENRIVKMRRAVDDASRWWLAQDVKLSDVGEELFKMFDKDGEGEISLSEMIDTFSQVKRRELAICRRVCNMCKCIGTWQPSKALSSWWCAMWCVLRSREKRTGSDACRRGVEDGGARGRGMHAQKAKRRRSGMGCGCEAV